MYYWQGNKEKELEYLKQEKKHIRDTLKRKPKTGLALSGGGIRSATFSLGALQVLAKQGVLEKIDYLSVVSGGGYIGSSLYWWWFGAKEAHNKVGSFDTKENFPYGCHDTEEEKTQATDQTCAQKKILQYLKSHGNYLTPGDGIDAWSFFGVIIRGLFIPILVWLIFLTLFFVSLLSLSSIMGSLLHHYEILSNQSFIQFVSTEQLSLDPKVLTIPAIFEPISLMIVFIVLILLTSYLSHSLATFAGWVRDSQPDENTRKTLTRQIKDWTHDLFDYKWRRFSERLYGELYKTLICLTVLLLIPIMFWKFNNGKDALHVFHFKDVFILLSGVATGVWGYYQRVIDKVPTIATRLVLAIGTGLFIYGASFITYQFALALVRPNLFAANSSFLADIPFMSTMIGLAIFTFILSVFVNKNLTSPHRYYRDRLMESFMPDWTSVDKNIEGRAYHANEFRLSNSWNVTAQKHVQAPFPIINTNVVLANEKVDKAFDQAENNARRNYKYRGGDSFVLTPFACGSQATGWCKTNKFMRNDLTLPTAMAISAAAANPNSAYLGSGQTRNKALSFVMRILNLRLGYWVFSPNPNAYLLLKWSRLFSFKPNHIFPTLLSELPFSNIHTRKSSVIELTDGGHFDNLGVYELLRRQLETIIVIDGEADPKTLFNALISLKQRAKDDFDVDLKFKENDQEGLAALVEAKPMDFPAGATEAKTGFVIADICYNQPYAMESTQQTSEQQKHGKLIYIKATMIKEASLETKAYKGIHPEFPDQTTLDQFFDQEQFEAYRDLGQKITLSALANINKHI